jgi:hypothetical protein
VGIVNSHDSLLEKLRGTKGAVREGVNFRDCIFSGSHVGVTKKIASGGNQEYLGSTEKVDG